METKTHSLAAWDLVCKPKKKGGLGVINLEFQNIALLIKHLDKFFNQKSLPWVQLIWNKYYLNSDKPPHAHKEKGSFWLKDIFRLIPYFRAFSQVTLGQGNSAFFWKDIWNNRQLEHEFPILFSFAKNKDITIQSFLTAQDLSQKFHLPLSVQAMQEWEGLSDKIQGIQTNINPDKWTYSWNTEIYHSKKVYKLFFNHLEPAKPLTLLWQSKSVMKLKVFLWLLLMNRHNTKELLQKKNFVIQGGIHCVMCNSMVTENMLHLFFSCPFAQQCWQKTGIHWNLGMNHMSMIISAYKQFPHRFFFEVLAIGCWNIWRRRNDLIFNKIALNFDKWKTYFQQDFALHMHRAKEVDIPH